MLECRNSALWLGDEGMTAPMSGRGRAQNSISLRLRRFDWQRCAILSGLFLTTCVPLQYTYFQPRASSGTVEPRRASCGGPSDHITFAAPGLEWIEVRLSAQVPDQVSPRQLDLELTIVRRIPFDLLFMPSVQAQKERSDRYSALMYQPIVIEAKSDTLVVTSTNGDRSELQLGLPENVSRWVFSGPYLRLHYSIPSFSGDSFAVDLPAMSFNGALLVFPRIDFRLMSTFDLTPINC
jgi:hypothetical protein